MVLANPRRLTDRAEIAARLSRDPGVHLYEIGDLDDFFFSSCTYFAHPSAPAPALLYEGADTPTLLALAREPSDDLAELVAAIAGELPRRVYAHLAVGLAESLAPWFDVEPNGLHAKLELRNRDAVATVDITGCERIGPGDLPSIGAFYEAAYPGSWFVPRMLSTGAYFGVRDGDVWVAVAGVHVVSREYRVAALGNVATLPEVRGRGLARKTCAAVIRALDGVEVIGLNVLADNEPALACYRALGFENVCAYEEVFLTRRG
ncbi:MAG: GNAT family N-acetyltransferase [Polyangiaceae bacterium]|nr:GNAT family N-acetyltransferase [Polyangiaceae bacterium]